MKAFARCWLAVVVCVLAVSCSSDISQAASLTSEPITSSTSRSSAAAASSLPVRSIVDPTADSILDGVLANLPADPIKVSGDFIVRRRRGIVEQTFQFDMQLKWGERPSVAEYVILNSLGTPLESLRMTRSGTDAPGLTYRSGALLERKDIPGLYQSLQGSDISWADLTLSFLWWRGGRIRGTDTFKGRSCYVLEVPAPETDTDGYGKVVLWIDARMPMLLQAEGYARDGKVARSLWVRSFRKINDRWMLKDLEVQDASMDHRTSLIVRDVNSLKED